jgi:hypothetical protein
MASLGTCRVNAEDAAMIKDILVRLEDDFLGLDIVRLVFA